MTGRSLLNGGVVVKDSGGGGGDDAGTRCRFEELLGEFLQALNLLRLYPPMLGDGKKVDLYKLYMVVKGKGGYEAVCNGKLWDLVGEESGCGVRVGPTVKVFYSKYLSPLDTWGKKFADSKVVPECVLVGDRDRFGRCLMELKAQVKGMLDGRAAADEVDGEKVKGDVDVDDDYENGRELCGANKLCGLMDESVLGNLCGGNDRMEGLEGFDGGKMSAEPEIDATDAVNSSMPGLLSEGDSEKSACKRKRQSMFDLLRWVAGVAKNPCDPAVGLVPEKSKWNSYSNQEFWKQVLLFREAVFFKKVFESSTEQQTWQTQKMHPCMYDDPLESAYNLRERQKCNNEPSSRQLTSAVRSSSKLSVRTGGKSGRTSVEKELLSSSGSKSGFDGCPVIPIPLGPRNQAEVPEWTGLTSESDSKWLGTQIWPLQKVNSRLLIERDPIGKGRQDLCGCSVPGSVECVRFHIAEKMAKVKLELGVAFHQWNLDKIGEGVRLLWTDEEQKNFKDAVEWDPPSSEGYLGYFWDPIFKTFPQKSTADLVSYYLNVFLLQRRGHQNRHTPDDANSEDDESQEPRLRSSFGRTSCGSISLTPKKPRPKGKRRK